MEDLFGGPKIVKIKQIQNHNLFGGRLFPKTGKPLPEKPKPAKTIQKKNLFDSCDLQETHTRNLYSKTEVSQEINELKAKNPENETEINKKNAKYIEVAEKQIKEANTQITNLQNIN